MRVLAGIAAAAAALAAAGCSESEPPRCEMICARDAECAQALAPGDVPAWRESECARACAAFERDPDSRARVDEREACVEAADDCEAVLACADTD